MSDIEPYLLVVGVDLDDVVAATFPTVKRIIKETAKIMGLPVPDDRRIEEVYDYAGNMARKLFPDSDIDEFLRICDSFEFSCEPVDGAIEAIEFLAENDARTWVFTGTRPDNCVRERCTQIGVDPAMFYRIIGGDSTHPYRKPDERAWDACVQELAKTGIKPQGPYIDDDIRNYRQAKKRRWDAILLLGSPNSRGYEACVPHEDILVSMRQLPDMLIKRGFVEAYRRR